MIRRDKYLNQLIKARNNGFPKVVTGVRRCGKSFLLEEIFRSYLLSDGVNDDNIVILELDDDKKAAMVSNLLVVLCGDDSAQPVVNTGTLNH